VLTTVLLRGRYLSLRWRASSTCIGYLCAHIA
jgi:hypothetical protein